MVTGKMSYGLYWMMDDSQYAEIINPSP